MRVCARRDAKDLIRVGWLREREREAIARLAQVRAVCLPSWDLSCARVTNV